MAKQEKRGWIWNDEEKSWVKKYQREVRIEFKRINTQVERFADFLPVHSEEFQKIAEPFLKECSEFLTIDGRNSGRKYNSISPEEAQKILSETTRLHQKLINFIQSKDVQKKIKTINKINSRKNRENYKLKQFLRSKVIEKINSDEFSKKLDNEVSWLLNESKAMSLLIINLTKYGSENDSEIIHKLLLANFIRYAYVFDADKKIEIEKFISSSSELHLRALLKRTCYIIAKEDLMFTINSNGQDIQKALNLRESLSAILADAIESLTQSIKEWKKIDVLPSNISSNDFLVLGYDCSENWL